MPEAELARVDECDRSIPRRETIRGTHWQKTPFGCLDLASRNPSWQRSCATATTDRTYDRKRSDSHEQTLATRGPSTYGSLRAQGRRATSVLRTTERRAERMPRIHADDAEFAREELQFLQCKGEALVLGMAIDVGIELRGGEFAVDHVAFQFRHVDAVGSETAERLVERGGQVAHPENKSGDQWPRTLFGPVRLARQHH